jgi:hypothetical protein
MQKTQVVSLGIETVLDLDVLFKDQFEENQFNGGKSTLEGTPEGGANDTFTVKYGSPFKLAGNAREYKGVTLYDYYNFSGWTEGNFHRTEMYGPLVEGPYASLFELATVVAARREPDEVAFLIEEGTVIKLKGTQYRVTFPKNSRGKFPKLVKVPSAEELLNQYADKLASA